MEPRTARGMAKNSGVSCIVRLCGIHHLGNVSRWAYLDCHYERDLLNQTTKRPLSGIDRGALPIKQIYLNLLNERQIVEILGERLLDYDRQFS